MGKGFEHLSKIQIYIYLNKNQISFDYFIDGLKSLKKMSFKSCEVLDDRAIARFSYVKDSLEEVVFVFCPLISDVGLTYLYLLK